MEKFRRHNSAPMCDLTFAVTLDGGLSQTLFGRTEETPQQQEKIEHIDTLKNGKNEHPRWTLLQAAKGNVSHLVTSNATKPDTQPDQHDDWTIDETTGGGFADIDANPMRRCLRQDAQSYLRQIAKLEQQLKTERDNGRHLVLAHHQETEALKAQLSEREEDLRQSKNQCERVKEGYDQVMKTMKTLVPPRDNESVLQIERLKLSEKSWQRKYEESDTIVKELQGKLTFYGLGDTPSSTKFSYSVKEYEEVSQALTRRQLDYEKLQENLATNAVKWGQEIKTLKVKSDSAVNDLDNAKRTIDDLKGQLHSEKERSAYQLRRTEKENLGKHSALVCDKETELRRVVRQREQTERLAIWNLFSVLSETV